MLDIPLIPHGVITYCQTLFSQILIPNDCETQNLGVIKRGRDNNIHLINQVQVLSKMQRYQGFPKIKFVQKDQFGTLKSFCIGKLGYSLKTLLKQFKIANLAIPIENIIGLALQMLQRVQDLHSNDFLHMDIKPQHFLFQNNNPQSCLYLIDFGLSQKISVKSRQEHKQPSKFKGNLFYSSLAQMKCIEYSIKDDLQSLVYIIAEMIEGQLPWRQNSKKTTSDGCLKRLYSKVLQFKSRKIGWKKCGQWVKQTIFKIQTESDPYYELRSSICKLVQLQF